jgi:hypothetical protein
MEALQAGDPDLMLFLTAGYSLPWRETVGDRRPLSQVLHGLEAPFLDGMFEAARGGTRIVDGYEMSYTFRTREQFRHGADEMRRGALSMVADSNAYLQHASVSFGIWMDNQYSGNQWYPDEPHRNYFKPDTLQQALDAAFDEADEYVWLYSQKPRWWSAEGVTKQLPTSYVEAVRRSHERAHGQRRRR